MVVAGCELLGASRSCSGRLPLASIVAHTTPTSPPLPLDVVSVDDNHEVVCGCFSPRARASSVMLTALPDVSATSVGEPIAVVVASVLQVMPDERMCGGSVSPSLPEPLEVNSRVPSVVAWAPTSPPQEPSQTSSDEESVSLGTAGTHSPEPIGRVVPMGDGVVVAGVPVPYLGDMFTIKFVEYLTNLDSTKSKTFGCL